MYAVQLILYAVQLILYTVHCTVNTVHCIVNTVHCTVNTVRCTVNTVHCTVNTVQCTIYRVLATPPMHTNSTNSTLRRPNYKNTVPTDHPTKLIYPNTSHRTQIIINNILIQY